MNCSNLDLKNKKNDDIEEVLRNLYRVGVDINPFKYDFVYSHIPVGPLTKVTERGFDFSRVFKTPYPSTFYIHIPFCSRMCSYCYFIKEVASSKDRSKIWGYLRLLKKEFHILQDYFTKQHWQNIESIYVGGGTPSVLNQKEMEFLFTEIIEPIKHEISRQDLEVAVEVHPENINKEKLQYFIKKKVERISFGFQTFNTNILKKLGRNYEGYDIVINVLKENNFKNWNVDMIYGLPHQTCEDLQEDVNKISDIKPPSVTWYQLWTYPRRKEREILSKYKKNDFMSKEEFIKAKIYIDRSMKEAGYINISGDWYVQKEDFYTKYEKYKVIALGNVGIGRGYYGYYNGYIFENEVEFEDYKRAIEEENRLPLAWIRKMDPVEQFIRKFAMNIKGLQNSIPVSIDEFKSIEAKARKRDRSFFHKANILLQNKILIREDGNIVLSPKYNIFRDYIIKFLLWKNGWFVEKKGILETYDGLYIFEGLEAIRSAFKGMNLPRTTKYSVSFFVSLFEVETKVHILGFSRNYSYSTLNAKNKRYRFCPKIPATNSFSFLKEFYLPPGFLVTPVCIEVGNPNEHSDVPNIQIEKVEQEAESFLNRVLSVRTSLGNGLSFDYVKRYYQEYLREHLQVDQNTSLYVYHIPFFENKGVGGIELGITHPLTMEQVLQIKKVTIPYFAERVMEEINKYEVFEIEIKAIMVALSSIMSRNMSHHAGSHVLSEIVATGGIDEPDREAHRAFFRYMQHRMDFIAQVTTETPKWTYGAWFHKEIMREFYNQHIFLDKLNLTEGLEIYEWPENGWAQADTREKLIVRSATHSKDQSKDKRLRWLTEEFRPLNPAEDCNNGSDPCYGTPVKDDFKIAVPGGGIGYHALFVILEDVIRNAAKHEYVGWRKEIREKVKEKKILILTDNESLQGSEDIEIKACNWGGNYEEYSTIVVDCGCDPEFPDNLDVKLFKCVNSRITGQKSNKVHLISSADWDQLQCYLDLKDVPKFIEKLTAIPLRVNIKIEEDDKDRDIYWITVWSNYPWEKKPKTKVDGEEKEDNKEIYEKLNEKLEKSFIDNTGKMQYENWGLAEMKIAAGYLQMREVTEIGGSGDQITAIDQSEGDYPKGIIRAVPVDEYGKIIESLDKPEQGKDGQEESGKTAGKHYYLGYRFWVRKAKDVLYVNGK